MEIAIKGKPENTHSSVTLTEKEAHCIARLLQGAFFGERNGGNVLAACAFCKFKCFDEKCADETRKKAPWFFREVRQTLESKTGVDLSPRVYGHLYGWPPIKKFLKNANEETKEFCRKFFDDI
ncbi:MAG: hypothetical protein IJ741_03715 [Schwartzia sp.]|nr:hypothetical protein [Schwartzia sp. (in: firmicutes)]